MDTDGFASFLVGVAVGVGLGLLFAPKSGEETREIIKKKADEGTEYLKKQTADLRDTASARATDLVDKGLDAFQRQRDNLNDALEAGRQAYREKVDGDGSPLIQPA
jgi:gas vesicle protein